MRVAHFRQEFSTLTETFIYDYVTEMHQQGVDTHFVTLRRVNEDSRPFPNVTVVERPSRWHPCRLWHRALVPFSERKPLHAEWPIVRDRLEEALREIQPDLVHAHFGPAGTIIAPVASEKNVPFIVSFHGFDAFKLPDDPFWRDKYETLFGQASKLTAVSHVMADHLMDTGAPEEKIEVIRVGKRLEDYSFLEPDSPVRRWVSVGGSTAKKGHEDCINAFGQLVERFPDSSVDIIGTESQSLRKQIEAEGLRQNVRLLGQRPHSEVKKRMQHADGFVLCSKTADDGDREGVPTVLMEAQAIGLPVVSTMHSGIPEVIPEDNHEFLAPEGDVNGLAERLCRLTTLPSDELTRIGKKGRKKVEQDFNLSGEVESLQRIYRSSVRTAMSNERSG